jgi:hypothetical protein
VLASPLVRVEDSSDTTSRRVSRFAVSLRLYETDRKLHRNAIDPSRNPRTMRAPQGEGETVIRKDAKIFAGGARWWSAPARLRSVAAMRALLGKAASLRPAARDPWVRQTPNGIRV